MHRRSSPRARRTWRLRRWPRSRGGGGTAACDCSPRPRIEASESSTAGKAFLAEAVPVGLAADGALDAGRPVGIVVVRVLDLEADRAREAGAAQVAEDRRDVELAPAERRE